MSRAEARYSNPRVVLSVNSDTFCLCRSRDSVLLSTTQSLAYGCELLLKAPVLFDVNGFCDCERMLQSEAWSSDANKGGLVLIYMVRVDKEHRGRELGLQALRHLLTVELKGEWNLAMIYVPDLTSKNREDEEIREEFSSMQSTWQPISEEMKRRKAEVAERDARGSLAVKRYFARMGFTQASFDFWFLAAGKPMLRPRAECDALPVMTKPSEPILSEAEEKLVEMARAAAPIQATGIEALVAQGVRLASSAYSHLPCTCLHAYLLTYLLTYLLIYLLIYLRIHTYIPTYLPTYLPDDLYPLVSGIAAT